MGGNEALLVNSGVAPRADLEINRAGSDWYFTVCSVMGFSTLVFMGLAMTKPQTHRVFHYITAAITATATIAYFAMGSNLGQVPIQAEFVRPYSHEVAAAGTREIFWVRYVDWFITTPLLLVDLLLTAGMPWPTILAVVFADWVMIITGLVGSLISSTYKWGFFSFGCTGLFYILYELIIPSRRQAAALGEGPRKAYMSCGILLSFLWILYPVAWGLSEGGNVIHPDSEAIFYGILDIFAKPVWGALLLWGHRGITPQQLGLHIRDVGEPLSEKHRGPHGALGGSPDGPVDSGVTNNANPPATAPATGPAV